MYGGSEALQRDGSAWRPPVAGHAESWLRSRIRTMVPNMVPPRAERGDVEGALEEVAHVVALAERIGDPDGVLGRAVRLRDRMAER